MTTQSDNEYRIDNDAKDHGNNSQSNDDLKHDNNSRPVNDSTIIDEKKWVNEFLDKHRMSWTAPKWLTNTSNNANLSKKYQDYNQLFLCELRARYIEIESDFRAAFSDFRAGETDWSVAEIMMTRLDEAKTLLEDENPEKHSAAIILDSLDRYLIWIFPPAIVKTRTEILSEDIANRYPTFSTLLKEAIKNFDKKCGEGSDKNEELRNLRAVFDEVRGKINRDNINAHTIKELQLVKMKYLNKLGVVILMIAFFVLGLFINIDKIYKNYIEDSHFKKLHDLSLDTNWILIISGYIFALATIFVGAMGAFISGMMQVRNSKVNLADYQETKSKLYLRLLIGGTMALIVILCLSKGVLEIEIKNEGTYLLLAFLSGFSERYFLRIFKLTSDGEVVENKGIKNN